MSDGLQRLQDQARELMRECCVPDSDIIAAYSHAAAYDLISKGPDGRLRCFGCVFKSRVAMTTVRTVRSQSFIDIVIKENKRADVGTAMTSRPLLVSGMCVYTSMSKDDNGSGSTCADVYQITPSSDNQ